MDIKLTVIEGMAPEEEVIILDNLKAYNAATFGNPNRRDLAIPLSDGDGHLIGGLTGYTARGWLYISMLYVPEEMRGRGLGARMLALAENEARARNSVGAYIDTTNPQALRLYLKQGYVIIGSLNDMVGGHCVTWLEKRF